jgi:hypothetical protein
MPQINSGKSPPWVSGEIVTAAGLNGMIDAATLDPSAITSQTEIGQAFGGTPLDGSEFMLVVDSSGQLKKTEIQNVLLTGQDIETNVINGANGAGNTTLQLVAGSDFLLACGGLGGLPNTGIEIIGTGVPVKIKSVTASGGSASAGGLMFESAGYGMDFSSTNNGTVRFAQRALFNTTGAIKLPVGTTAQRPATPVAGDTRFNSTTSKLEFHDGTAWTACVNNATGSISSGLLLYDVYEEAGTITSAITHTKPVNEIWIVEIQFNHKSNGSHLKYPVYSAGSEDVFVGTASASYPAFGGDWVTFRKVYNSSTTLTSQTLGLWGWTGGPVNLLSGYFRIYKYRQA